MEYSLIKKSEIVSDFRLDAECYKKNYIKIDKVLSKKPHSTIGNEISVFSKGIFDIKAECYTNKGVPFVRINNLKNMIIDDTDIIHIPEVENEKYKKTSLYYGDFILSKTAYPAASLVTLPIVNTSQDTIAVRLKDNSNFISHFVVLFLNCRFGYYQMQRWFTGNVQMHLNLSDSKNILLPIFSNIFQKLTKDCFELSISTIKLSKSIYNETETLLLSELGLLGWEPKHQLSFVKNFSDTQEAGRFDAEYFQPKYEKIVKAIKKYKGGWDTLGNVLNVKDKNIIPKDKVKYKYIELANIGNNGEITGFTEAEGQELPTRARRKVNKNDIIISSIEGSLSSIALITPEYDNALCSTGFYVVNSDKINPETLLVLLKSTVGQLQLKKGCSGTILTAINRDELNRIVLPLVENKIQNQIQQKITESFKLRKQSKQLLEAAKKAVEMAIEKSEEEAERWLRKEMDKIDV